MDMGVNTPDGLARRWRRTWRRWERITRTVDPELAAALARRWAELPERARTPAQLLGRNAVGCEGTHGVFPRCNLTCTPCYHSADANKVRIDGAHTVAEVRRQLAYLRRVRGPRGHAQLIGGEVSLLPPDDHAAALLVMREYGREPMSMTHGDFDYEYLRDVALGSDGRPRLHRLSFAAHIDSLMRGRRDTPRPRSEAELTPARWRFAAMFRRLRREHGVRSYLAHNMTVTPHNLGQVAEVIRETRSMGYAMMSFQPAAAIGDERRWKEDYRTLNGDHVWAEIERGAGTRLPWRALQMGDERCNRTAFGFYLGDRWIPLIDDRRLVDLAARDAFLRHLGGVNVGGTPPRLLTVRLLRALVSHSTATWTGLRWAAGLARRAGLRLLTHRIRPMTFVMHSFIHADQVRPAWALLEQGIRSEDPEVRATQDRLLACSYAMAHPEQDRLVPACVQHAVHDPGENAVLRRLLPLRVVTDRDPRSEP